MKSISLRAILTLIYMRTVLEIVIEYNESGTIVSHGLTPITLRIYNSITNFEKAIYKKNKKLYMKASDISKIAYPISRDKFPNHEIFLEPMVCGLYYSSKKDMKNICFVSSLIDDMIDQYYFRTNCDGEVESVLPIDDLWKETEKAIFEYNKMEKRK